MHMYTNIPYFIACLSYIQTYPYWAALKEILLLDAEAADQQPVRGSTCPS